MRNHDIETHDFPSDLDRHPLLMWMGDDWVAFVTEKLLTEFQRQDPGTKMISITCEGPPELETRAVSPSGTVTAVSVGVPLRLLLRDSSGRYWRLGGVGLFAGEGLTEGPPSHTTSFEIASTEQVTSQGDQTR